MLIGVNNTHEYLTLRATVPDLAKNITISHDNTNNALKGSTSVDGIAAGEAATNDSTINALVPVGESIALH